MFHFMDLARCTVLPLFLPTLPLTALMHQLCPSLKSPLLQSSGAAELMASFLQGLGLRLWGDAFLQSPMRKV